MEGSVFGHVLATGWDIDVGGRSLFFNPQMSAAWAIDLGLSNINNQGQRSDIMVPFFVTPAPGQTLELGNGRDDPRSQPHLF